MSHHGESGDGDTDKFGQTIAGLAASQRAAPLKIGVGIPAYGGDVAVEHTRMWMEYGFTLACSDRRFQSHMFGHVDVCSVEKARSIIVARALEAECDWLLMVDADTWVATGGTLLEMISTADHEGVAVVAGAVPRRFVGMKPAGLAAYRRDPSLLGRLLPINIHPLGPNTLAQSDQVAPNFIGVDSVGTAVFAVDLRFVKTKLTPPWFRFTRPGETGEDHDFCARIQAAGGLICVDRRVKCRHRNIPVVLRTEETE